MKNKRVLERVSIVLMFILCLATLIPLFVTSVQTHPAPTWGIEVVDSEGDVGASTSLALDSADYPHISYYNATGGDLKYAKWTTSGWHVETVDSEGDVGASTSLALDSLDRPHISYSDSTNDDLKYAWWDGSDWNIEIVDQEGEVGGSSSLALDSNDYPHISYSNRTYELGQPKTNLKYAWKDVSGWHVEDLFRYRGPYSSLALDSNDDPHMSYFDWTNYNLLYARWNGSMWHSYRVDWIYNVGQWNSLALDSGDNPHISYYDDEYDALKYANRTGLDPWNKDLLDQTGTVGRYSSLALDFNEKPHISYYDATHTSLKYWNGTDWSSETIPDPADWVGEYSSLALGSNDRPHITYYDRTNEDLKYATSPPRQPVADANGPYSGIEGQPVTFDGSGSYDQDGGTILSYDWDFGDDDSGTGLHPTHTYAQDGTYTVNLTVTDDDGLTNMNSTTATILDTDPLARFSGTPRSGNPPLTVTFTDLSTSYDGIVSWLWDFGDGQTGTLQNPTHKYTDPGLYTVSLIVGEADGDTDSEIKEDYVTVHLFTIEVVDSRGDVGAATSLALDSDSYPHISYYDATRGVLRYTRWTGTKWQTEGVGSAGDDGTWTSLALDADDHPHISYYRSGLGDLMYATWDGLTWKVLTVDSVGTVGMFSSLAFNADGVPCISYLDATNGDLKYARKTGVTWNIETVDSAGTVGAFSSLAFNADGVPYISYYEGKTGGDLKLAVWDPISSTWVIERIDSVGDVGLYTSLALYQNRILISYYDATLGNLKLAEWTGKAWHIEIVDMAGDVGLYTSLVLDRNGNPCISYYDATNGDLKYARRNGAAWVIERIDSVGNVGLYTSLALDHGTYPHISYYDNTNNDLKYAHVPPIPGDIDGDGYVGSADAGILNGAYGSWEGDPIYVPEADLDGDGYIGSADAGILNGNYGNSYP